MVGVPVGPWSRCVRHPILNGSGKDLDAVRRGFDMRQLYSGPTPNGVHAVDIGAGAPFGKAFPAERMAR